MDWMIVNLNLLSTVDAAVAVAVVAVAVVVVTRAQLARLV